MFKMLLINPKYVNPSNSDIVISVDKGNAIQKTIRLLKDRSYTPLIPGPIPKIEERITSLEKFSAIP